MGQQDDRVEMTVWKSPAHADMFVLEGFISRRLQL